MRRAFLAILALVFVSACAAPERITDFSDRSVVYTWLDTSGIPGNRLTYFEMRNLSAPNDERYYGMGWEKVGSGFLVWHNGFTPGSYEFSKMQMMSCMGPLCTNQINEFDFGPAGLAPGKTRVGAPGVHFAGCYALQRTRRGFFRPGEFDVQKTRCGASRGQMLQVMLQNAPADHPIVAQRIRAAMAR